MKTLRFSWLVGWQVVIFVWGWTLTKILWQNRSKCKRHSNSQFPSGRTKGTHKYGVQISSIWNKIWSGYAPHNSKILLIHQPVY